MANSVSSVVAGDYQGYIMYAFDTLGAKTAYLCPKGLKGMKKSSHIDINKDTVKEINEKINNTDRSAGKSLAKEIMFGIGAATAHKAKLTVEIVFSDGKKCLVQTNNKDYEILLATCYK